MPAPTERPPTDATNAASARSDVDETVAAPGAPASGAAVVTGFAPPAAPGEVGTLGPYRIVKELGRGGMGAVYAAIDTRLDRQLALKVMLPQFAADSAAKERFLREARAAAKINHDNIVTVYEADERQGVPYIAMQFLEGYPLNEYLKKQGAPTIPQILRIAAETASGLAAAHKIGLVHRDIKPGNLWLEVPNGRVKVLDFGLAKPVDAEVELTKSGAVVGTPAYMSPEQARAEKVDARTDLFSLGSVLYRLCTGKLPFSGPTTMAVLMALGTEEPPPVREVNPAVPESLAALVHQLLSKRADARPQSAAEVVRRLRTIMEELVAPRALPVDRSTSQPQLMQPQVVYAVMPVTAAPPEQNPFADLDDPDTEMDSREFVEEPTAAPKPVGKKPSGRRLWPAVGFAALVALVAGVIIIIKNKDGTETKIEVPDGATVTVKDKGGKTLAQVGPGGKPSAPDNSPDRKAAEWVIAQGGSARVAGKDARTPAELPREPFTLVAAFLHGTKVSDTDLANLKELKSLVELGLNGTRISDAGLVHLKEIKSLTTLHLSGTQVESAGLEHLKELRNLMLLSLDNTRVSDAGLVHLKELKTLTNLYLSGTPVTGAGMEHLKELRSLTILGVNRAPVSDTDLAHLKELKSLKELYLDGTKVTGEGARELAAALPACRIEHNGGVIKPIDVDRKAAEWVIAQGGIVRVNGENKDIRAATELPKERFTLTYVFLSRTKATDAGLACLRGLKGLTTIGLDGTQVSGTGLQHLRELNKLTFLNLSGTKVTDAGLVYLKDLKSLVLLNLGGTMLADAGLVHLKELKNLTTLVLDGTKVTDAGLAHLKDLKSLKEINLNGTLVSGAGLEHLKGIDGLTRLDLNGAPVLDAGLQHLKGFQALTVLYLNGTKVSDEGLEHVKELKGLKGIDLRRTTITQKGLEALHAALPACTIHHDGGVIAPKKK